VATLRAVPIYWVIAIDRQHLIFTFEVRFGDSHGNHRVPDLLLLQQELL
jgi:hypothetical protein